MADLRASVPSVATCTFIPRGGEGHGALELGTVDREFMRGPAHAVATFWKALMCADEDWPYEPWSAQEAGTAARGPYREDWEQWSRPPESTRTTQQSIGTLRSLAHRVLTTPKPWLNEPQPFPPDAFDRRVLRLDFVCVGLLELLLCDHWNDVTAVFADPRRYYWIHWWTNA